ncbi:P-loop containing nucleoside triphosphate hydrolase protein [Leucogyrophana mollusca]|uniref:P-loop containing nucleoside triphosphate hydrolase protein n=1 Tax=Leucogyrophana mollusca TaxID=85980 RepID=A0ACB8BRN7_9AGAM|nr:P-loop containing nucleoside triphosphate hydrolase protein [Leucogyrophana mollusca]
MQTRSSVLGKRAHQADGPATAGVKLSEPTISSQPPLTPELTPKPKRARVSTGVEGDSNKENVPPFRGEILNDSSPTSLPSPSSLRRTSTELGSPSRVRATVRRHASVSNVSDIPNTPASSLSHLVISTPPPTPPVSLLPIYVRAKGVLRSVCSGSSSIAGREDERNTISSFITRDWDSTPDSAATSLYISGTPGTGKTALVNLVLRAIETDEGTSRVKVMSVNCMALASIDALWERLSEEFCAGKSTKASAKSTKPKGKQAIEKALTSSGRPCILVLDELDHIATSIQTLDALFSLSRSHPSALRIIGIANTHTLTSSLLQISDDSVAGVQTLHFAPYTSSQLLQVLQARLAPLHDADANPEVAEQIKKLLPSATLALLSKKIASQTGDVRALFEVLRGAIDAAVSAAQPSDADANPLATPPPVVTPNHILSALKAYLPSASGTRPSASTATPMTSNSEIVTKVQNLGLHARLVLMSTLLASKRLEANLALSGSITSSPTKSPVKRSSSSALVTGRISGIDAAQLHAYYSTILTRGDNDIFTPVSRSEFADLVGMLETVGLLSAPTAGSLSGPSTPSKSGRRGFGRSASFGGATKGAGATQEIKLVDSVRLDEVLRGLGIVGAHSDANHAREEEVKAIWARETARLNRDLKTKTRLGEVIDNPFEEAFEG